MRNFDEDKRICDALGKGDVWRAEGGYVDEFAYDEGVWYPLFHGEINPQSAEFIAEAREGWPAALARMNELEEELELFDQRGEVIERQLDMIEQLRVVNEAYRKALEQMDDRKHPMMPRSQMARLAREALDEAEALRNGTHV